MSSKQKQQISNEQAKNILNQVLAKEENKICADCHGKGPRWASWNLGVLLCIRCSGIHRSLGVHISRVKSVTLDSWTVEQLISVCSRGNGWASKQYEAGLSKDYQRPKRDSDMEHFIRNKYEKKKYYSRHQIPLCSLEEFDGLVEKRSRSNAHGSSKYDIYDQHTTSSRSTNSAVPRPVINATEPQQRVLQAPKSAVTQEVTKPAAVQEVAKPVEVVKSNVDDLLGLNVSPFPAQSNKTNNDLNAIFGAAPTCNGFTTSTPPPPQSEINPATTESSMLMSKDTILSLYGPSAPATRSYFMQGVPGQQMMGFQQPVPQGMAPAVAYPQLHSSYSQQVPVQQAMPNFQPAMQGIRPQQQYQWQQQQMQLHMQSMQIGAVQSTMQVPGVRAFGSATQAPQQPYFYPQNTLGNPGLITSTQQSGLAANQPTMDKTGFNWFQGTPMSNNQSSKQNFWK